MDPFVTRIGDVTIERVAPNTSSAEPPSDSSTTSLVPQSEDTGAPVTNDKSSPPSVLKQPDESDTKAEKEETEEKEVKEDHVESKPVEEIAVKSVKSEQDDSDTTKDGKVSKDNVDNVSLVEDGVIDQEGSIEKPNSEVVAENVFRHVDLDESTKTVDEEKSINKTQDQNRNEEDSVSGSLEDDNNWDSKEFDDIESSQNKVSEDETQIKMEVESGKEQETVNDVKEEIKDTESKTEEAQGSEEEVDIKKKLRTRQKRKIVVEDDSDESEEERKKKRRKRKKKGAKDDDSGTTEDTESEDDGSGKKKKKKKKAPKKGAKKKDDDDDGSGGDKSERKATNLRRNIREVMDETQLDEATLAAQRQEMERLQRVQEQQRALREMAQQRQQQQKAESRVISLLQGNTSILKQVSVGPSSQTSTSPTSRSSPNTVVVKVGSGGNAQINKKVLELLRVPKGTTAELKPSVTKTLVSKPRSLQGTTMMTPSVSIAPVRPGVQSPRPVASKSIPMIQPQASYSASEGEEDDELDEEILDELEEGKKKKKDVVTISSSSSSEDDCIVLSEPSDIGEDEEEDDPTNSGMHTNDLYNVPDDEGRVQVNMGKPDDDPDIFLAPHIARIIKPHQVGGIRFLFDNVIESIERFNTSTGFGCILAHSMGLGKTLQVVTFCDIFLRHTPGKTVMCIMPINTLQNWMAEFNMWMPEDPSTSPLAAQGEVRPRNFSIHVLNDSHKTLKARAKVIEDWSKEGGVLLIGYEMYRQLSLKKLSKPKKSRSRRKIVASDEEDLGPEEEEKRQKEILERVFEALVKPGPDLVICDEGHRIKNSHASISMALKQIRSKRRIVLTGYPLQNNLLEYWCMVDFVRPNYLGSKTEFSNMFERPIQNGQCIDSTPQDIRLMRYRAHVLHSLLEGFVQRRSHAVLQAALPQKEEYVLLVRMTPFQRILYDTFMNEVVRTKAVPNPLKAFAVCCKIWNHPDVLYQFLKKREGGEGVDLDLEEAAASLATNTVIDPTGTPSEERRPPKSRNKSGGGSKSRKKKDTTPSKPAAAVLPNTSSQQSDSNNPYGIPGQYPMHSQMSSSSMMGGYNPYGNPGQSPYSGPFSSTSHHYGPSNPYGHPGYGGNVGFNSAAPGNLNLSGQGSFASSASSGYSDPPASQTSQYGSASQSMFPSSGSGSSSSNAPGYGSMGMSSYFSGSSPSSQHTMNDSFAPTANYSSNWNNASNYNSFSQGQPNSQPPFSGQGYGSSNQSSSFQGYSANSSSNSFSPGMYGGSASGSGSASGGASQPYSLDQQQQLVEHSLMQPPSRPHHPNVLPQQSPVNASGMLPGGAPTKSPAMMPPNLLPNMDSLMSHHDMYPLDLQGPSASHPLPLPLPLPLPHPQPGAGTGAMGALSSMASADVPPSAEDLLHSSDDFRAFDPALGKSDSGRGMYDMKDRALYDAWSNSQSHSHDYSLVTGQDLKSVQNSALKGKADNENKFTAVSSPLEQLKTEMGEVKLDDKHGLPMKTKDVESENVENKLDRDNKVVDNDSWRVNSMEMADQEMKEDSKEKEGKDEEEEGLVVGADGKPVQVAEATAIPVKSSGREDPGIPYDWAVELMKDYVPGLIENSAKMVIFFCILEESLAIGDRVLVFSQSLFTLSLIEEYLQRSFIPVPGVYERWQRNRTYFRLDGSTAALEREKLINEFNTNPNVYLFLVSTRAGSLGINLVGANRVIVFDASWNPCHDTQAVCRVYRYGQKKPCFVYRLVMDNCLEKKIYDRQINKQGMSDRVVDECNPDAHLSIKEVTNLCWDDEKDAEVKDISGDKDKYTDIAMQKIVEKHWKLLSKAPFQHESLLVDRKDKKLSQAEKRLAKRSYEMEKRANNRPTYNYYNAGQGGLQIRPVQRDAAGNIMKPVASVRPMQAELNSQLDRTGNRTTKWIPAEVWQRQGMSAQEMTLPLDVVIPTNSPERASIVLKAGQRVMVLKSPKGIYMQLENGKIIAIRTAFKMGANNKGGAENKPFAGDKEDLKKGIVNKNTVKLSSGIHPLRNNPNITITPRNSPTPVRSGVRPILQRPLGARIPNPANMRPWVRPGGVAGRAVPLRPGQTLRPGLRGLSPSVTVTPANSKARSLSQVSMSSRLMPANLRENVPTSTGKVGDSSRDKGKVESRLEPLDSDDGQSSNSSSEFKADHQSNLDKNTLDFSSHVGSESRIQKGDSESLSSRDNSRQSDSLEGNFENSDSRSKLEISEQSSLPAAESKYVEENANSAHSSADTIPSAQDSSKASLKNFLQSSSSQRRPHPSQVGPENPRGHSRETGSESAISQLFPVSNLFSDAGKSLPSSSSSSSGFASGFSSSIPTNKQFSSNIYGTDMLSPPSYTSGTDQGTDEKSHKSSQPSNSVENQWKNPQTFSTGISNSKTSSQRSLGSPAFDDSSNNSAHSMSSKCVSNAKGLPVESRSRVTLDSGAGPYFGAEQTASASHAKSTSSKSHSHALGNHSSSSKSPTPTATSTPSSNFPLDPYTNLYGSYGAYPSNYYSPYGYAPGFLPDPKSASALTTKTASDPSRSGSSSKSSRSEAKKSSHDSRAAASRSDLSLPTAYDSRQPSPASTVPAPQTQGRSGGGGGSTTSSSGSSSAATTAATSSSSSSDPVGTGSGTTYNPMIMPSSFNTAPCQYPPPPSAAAPAPAPASANPFTAAAANYPNPYASPYGYPSANQFESDLARASMYSAFHRPDPGQFPDPASPYLPLTPAHTPAPAHSRAAPPAGSFYSQNMYGGQYGSSRDPYAQLPPYAVSPFMMPPAPAPASASTTTPAYGGVAPSSSSSSAADQTSGQ